MSYWEGNAPGYSRAVEMANEAVKAAQESLQIMLFSEYPRGSYVRVIHHRGSFNGYVAGWDHFGARVEVENENSGKISKWWASHVEVIEPTKQENPDGE